MASLRLPFVITVGVTAVAACGGTVTLQADDDGSGAGGSAGTSTSATSTGGQPSTSSGTNPPACPPDLVNGYTLCELPGTVCSYDVACQSGTVGLSFVCEDNFWQVLPQPCAYPYDSCPGTELYCDGSWWMPQGTNPPSPCPDGLPEQGTPCYHPNAMGGDWEHCGYPCGAEPDYGWIIASCVPSDGDGAYSWEHEGCVD